MKIHRFYIKDLDTTSDSINDTAIVHQIHSVLRYKTGELLNVFNENIGEWEIEIKDIHKKAIHFIYKRQIKIESAKEVQSKKTVLYMSIIKKSNFDLVVEKAVELGATEVIPVLTERTIKTKLNMERLQKIALEATEQCGRIDLMKIGDIMGLHDAIAQSKLYSEQVFFGHINDANMNHPDVSKSDALFIGPEGGWSEEEVRLFTKENILPISLGQYVLRAETAAIVGISKII